VDRVGLLCLDVDGTIAGEWGVYPEAVDLLRMCTRMGVRVALCSARPTASLMVLAGEHPCIGHIAGLGGTHVRRLRGGGAELVSITIDAEVASGVGRRTAAADVELWWYAGDTWFVAAWTDAVRSEARTVWVEPVVVGTFDGLPDPNKLLVIDPGETVGADLQRFAEASELAWRVSGSADLEVISGAVSVAKGLDVIASDLDIAAVQVVAVGDGANDVGMLAFAGVAFALPPLADTPTAGGFTALPHARRGGLAALTGWLTEQV
jgi:HAD superfamily hydrolase (TIGR01484 family)